MISSRCRTPSARETRKLKELGFKAIASTSHGLSLTLGKNDYSATIDETLENLRVLVAASDLPVNADFEAGFAVDTQGVAANVRRAAETGICGLSIEDRTGDALYDLPVAVERLKSARASLDGIYKAFLLVGRTERYLLGNPDLGATIERLKAYSDAGADVLYAPGVEVRRDQGDCRGYRTEAGQRPSAQPADDGGRYARARGPACERWRLPGDGGLGDLRICREIPEPGRGTAGREFRLSQHPFLLGCAEAEEHPLPSGDGSPTAGNGSKFRIQQQGSQ
jgi:hypothetical protein